jgi:PAS domain S-box-containing protein
MFIDGTAFESAPTGLVVVGVEGRILRTNRRYRRMIRRDFEELAGLAFSVFVHPEDRERADLRIAESAVGTMRDLGRVRFVRPDDSVVWGGVAVARVADGDAAAVVHVPDLSDLVRAEERLGLVVGGLDDGVVVFDPVGELVTANPAAVRLLGQMVAREWGDGTRDVDITILDEDGLSISNESRPEVIARTEGASAEGSGAVVDGDGEMRWLEIAAHPLERTHAQRFVVATYKDVSEHRRIATALRAAMEADRAKSEFLSRMSHELRTPLNAVLGFAQLLEMSVLDARQRESVTQILSAGRHLLDLVDDLLDLDRIDREQVEVDVEPVRVAGVLQEAFELVQPLAVAKGIVFDLQLGRAARAHVVADRRRLRQVLLNLFTNAINYNRPNGSVVVACRERDEIVVIRVRDTGYGLSAGEQSRIFTPFERLNAEQRGIEGTGVGLALSKHLTEAMGGIIGVESRPDEGSTFWVALRLAPPTIGIAESAPPVDPECAAAVLARTASVPRRILYIEDNDASRVLTRELMAHLSGVELVTASLGREGIEYARAQRPDVILLDLHLPDMRGEDVLRELRADTSMQHTPVIVISADAVPSRIEEVTKAGAAAYITKPIEAAALFSALESAFDAPQHFV